MSNLTAIKAVRYNRTDGNGVLRVSKAAQGQPWKVESLATNGDLLDIEEFDTIPSWMTVVRATCDMASGHGEDF